MKLLENMVLPRFYAIPMFLALSLKSAADAFFEVNSVKYLYFFLLIFGVFFMRTGRGYDRQQVRAYQGTSQSQLWIFVVAYFSFLTLLMIFQNGTPQMIFKIVSPFVFFGLVVAASDASLPFAIAVGAALNIVANAALLPFDFGWTYWGGVHTFKGFYLFKTDLAYSLATSLLAYSAWCRFKPTPSFIVLAILAVIQVILANSRMNYLTLGIVLVYIALKNGAKPSSLLIYGGFLGGVLGIAFYLYDSSQALGFDTSNMASFTQGRDRIVEVLFKYGLANYTPTELLFGRGLFADLLIYMENISDGMPHGAHNDFLYQLVTQGVFGLILNVMGWTLLYKIAKSAGVRKWAKGLAFVSFLLYISQGFSATVSLFALKTWPIATLLLLIYFYPDAVEVEEVPDSQKTRRSTAVSLV